MKKVTGYINVRALGHYDWEFYVEDNTTDEEIEKMVEDTCNYYIHYNVEEGYEKVEVTETKYIKKG